MVTKLKAPAAHHVAFTVNEGKPIEPVPAITMPPSAAREGTDAGGIGIVVGGDRGKGQVCLRDPLRANRGDNAGQAKAGMQQFGI